MKKLDDKDLQSRARKYAERLGITEYKINDTLLEYWTFYQYYGWFFVRYDLVTEREIYRGSNIPPPEPNGILGIPAFLISDSGASLYNYEVG